MFFLAKFKSDRQEVQKQYSHQELLSSNTYTGDEHNTAFSHFKVFDSVDKTLVWLCHCCINQFHNIPILSNTELNRTKCLQEQQKSASGRLLVCSVLH